MSDASVTAIPTLSDDSALEFIISDIPFFCIGLTAIAIFTFFLFMRQVSLLSVYLYTASLLGFIAAILDLSQILVRGRANVARGIGLEAVSGFLVARELFLALSIGFLYLYLWSFVALCPRGECRTRPDLLKMRYNAREHAHSASWKRWGILGMILQWTTLAASISIPLLQILWRIVSAQHTYGSLYIAESTIETVLSAIFILKLLLNIFLSPVTPRWLPLRMYIVPIVSLMLSAGLGVGNIVAFAFSESTLGRFLRAVEIYFLIVYSLIVTFYPVGHPLLRDERPQSVDVTMDNQPEKSRPPSILIQRHSGESQQQPAYLELTQPPRTSTLTSWIMPRRFSRRPEIVDPDPELGLPSAVPHILNDNPKKINSYLSGDRPRSSALVLDTSISPAVRPSERPVTEVSLSYYTMERLSQNLTPIPIYETPDRETDSPVYGLEGIILRRDMQEKQPSEPQHNRSQNDSLTSFDELLRQQTELDQSIAALRLFSPQSTQIPAVDKPAIQSRPSINPQDGSQNRSLSTVTSTSTGQKPESASGRSEFSLSNFPEPPAVVDNVEASPSRFLAKASDVPRARPLQEDSPKDNDHQQSIGNVSLVAPSSSRFGGTPKSDSGGTQYDVTSFIGDLSDPSDKTELNGEEPLESKTVPRAPVLTSTLRPMILPSIVSPRLSPTQGLSGTPLALKDNNGSLSSSRESNSIVLRPFLLGTSSPAINSPLSTTMVPIGSRRARGGSNARRPAISVPRLTLQENENPGAFERPRPPPLRLGIAES
ncbi:hypothetical protein BDQ12DRAFT_678762 [Crucibulum laeve]|uniref:Uncharacterized protein n=1 Tax=Crucibulum laeve TaxID=68775 RepID=A0A5C3M8K4_9AGAR|nr:hypothetical protein BDQ12DRAFT_678762 [Crucibulum laeve]